MFQLFLPKFGALTSKCSQFFSIRSRFPAVMHPLL